MSKLRRRYAGMLSKAVPCFLIISLAMLSAVDVRSGEYACL
jgi:hypothetical protein